MAAETADNACIGGAIVPLLSLGIPGSPPAAVLLGALLIHGIRPGPMLGFEFPAFIYQCVAWLTVATFFMWVISIFIAKPMQKILTIKNSITMPIVAVLCTVGAFSMDIRFLDLILLFASGLLGLLFKRGKYPAAPLVLGIILGPLVDSNFRRALQSTHGSFSIFVTRPLALVLLVSTLILVLAQLGVLRQLRRLLGMKSPVG